MLTFLLYQHALVLVFLQGKISISGSMFLQGTAMKLSYQESWFVSLKNYREYKTQKAFAEKPSALTIRPFPVHYCRCKDYREFLPVRQSPLHKHLSSRQLTYDSSITSVFYKTILKTEKCQRTDEDKTTPWHWEQERVATGGQWPSLITWG